MINSRKHITTIINKQTNEEQKIIKSYTNDISLTSSDIININDKSDIAMLISNLNKIECEIQKLNSLRLLLKNKINELSNPSDEKNDLMLEFEITGNGKFLEIDYIDTYDDITNKRKIQIFKKNIEIYTLVNSAENRDKKIFHLQMKYPNNTKVNYTISYNVKDITDTNTVKCDYIISR